MKRFAQTYTRFTRLRPLRQDFARVGRISAIRYNFIPANSHLRVENSRVSRLRANLNDRTLAIAGGKSGAAFVYSFAKIV